MPASSQSSPPTTPSSIIALRSCRVLRNSLWLSSHHYTCSRSNSTSVPSIIVNSSLQIRTMWIWSTKCSNWTHQLTVRAAVKGREPSKNKKKWSWMCHSGFTKWMIEDSKHHTSSWLRMWHHYISKWKALASVQKSWLTRNVLTSDWWEQNLKIDRP